MSQSHELLEKMALPYYAHCQARIAPTLPSLAWNKVSLSGYLDLCLLLKGVESPASLLRKIRAFYEHYDKVANNHPILGELDSLTRNLIHVDKANPKATLTFALKWNSLVQEIEQYCFELICQRLINNPEQVVESLQSILFQMQDEKDLPRWNELLEQQQYELAKIIQLKNLPTSTFAKINFKQQFHGKVNSDHPWVGNMFNNDKELQDHIHVLNKGFLRLVNEINEKLPEPERHVTINTSQSAPTTPSPDYRLTITYYYDGNDEGNVQSNFFSIIRNILK